MSLYSLFKAGSSFVLIVLIASSLDFFFRKNHVLIEPKSRPQGEKTFGAFFGGKRSFYFILETFQGHFWVPQGLRGLTRFFVKKGYFWHCWVCRLSQAGSQFAELQYPIVGLIHRVGASRSQLSSSSGSFMGHFGPLRPLGTSAPLVLRKGCIFGPFGPAGRACNSEVGRLIHPRVELRSTLRGYTFELDWHILLFMTGVFKRK